MPRLRTNLILVLLWGIYFHPLILHPNQVLYADFSDFLAEHLPAKLFLNREWHETGAMPLWNPYHFCGTPFVHDIQIGCYYPPYAAMYVVPEESLGAVLSWVIALHVLIAGLLAALYARSHQLGEAGCFVAAAGFMFSAKWLTHLLPAGHTITIGLAWLPLVLLGMEKVIRSGRPWPAIGAGAALALLVLGTHPQWSFYAIVFAAAWTFPEIDSGWHRLPVGGVYRNTGWKPVPPKKFLRWLGCGLAMGAIAALLCAVQLLPTLEASGYSARSVGLESTQSLEVAAATLFAMVGPAPAYDPPASWESRALFGIFGLMAALAAPRVAPQTADSPARLTWHRLVLLTMIGFSLGGAILVEWLPGFNLFRVPSRMLLIAVFPLAFLAGSTVDSLSKLGWTADQRRRLLRTLLAIAVFPALSLIATIVPMRTAYSAEFLAYWIVAGVGCIIILAISLTSRLPPALRTALFIGVLFAELLAPAFRFVEVRPQPAIYPDSPLVQFLNANADPATARVLDIDAGTGPHDRYAPLGGGAPQALVDRIAMPRGYNPLDVRHYREFINYIIDRDERLLSLNPVAQPIIPNFSRINRSLFERLNVRYLICFLNYAANPEVQADPGLRLDSKEWRLAGRFENSPAVPALPPQRPHPLPPVLAFENQNWAKNPRAFVVPEARIMPAGQELAALKANDFHQTVLLSSQEPLPPRGESAYRMARITAYRPNRVTVDLAGGGSGFLVLNDVWFPDWKCRVDGVETPVQRGNQAFRAVAIPGGAREAVFTFEPRSFRIGWWVSAISLSALLLLALARMAASLVRR